LWGLFRAEIKMAFRNKKSCLNTEYSKEWLLKTPLKLALCLRSA
jgi:hypothetical protein